LHNDPHMRIDSKSLIFDPHPDDTDDNTIVGIGTDASKLAIEIDQDSAIKSSSHSGFQKFVSTTSSTAFPITMNTLSNGQYTYAPLTVPDFPATLSATKTHPDANPRTTLEGLVVKKDHTQITGMPSSFPEVMFTLPEGFRLLSDATFYKTGANAYTTENPSATDTPTRCVVQVNTNGSVEFKGDDTRDGGTFDGEVFPPNNPHNIKCVDLTGIDFPTSSVVSKAEILLVGSGGLTWQAGGVNINATGLRMVANKLQNSNHVYLEGLITNTASITSQAVLQLPAHCKPAIIHYFSLSGFNALSGGSIASLNSGAYGIIDTNGLVTIVPNGSDVLSLTGIQYYT